MTFGFPHGFGIGLVLFLLHIRPIYIDDIHSLRGEKNVTYRDNDNLFINNTHIYLLVFTSSSV